jgi:molybdopterin synthase catalytic subunit
MRIIRVQEHDFDVGTELSLLEGSGAGAVASFTGLVRSDDGVKAMTLEHYPAMTVKALEAIADDAATRWQLLGISVIHRVGRLHVGDRIVFVGTASPHRLAALEACAFLIDRLKTDAPFWKKEHGRVSGDQWVDARETDAAAARKWQQ